MKNWQKFILVILVAISALFARFVMNDNNLARLIVTVSGLILASTMLIDMIKTLKSGSYGVDILAITAIISTLAIGEYWASLIIIVMLVGGESLEDFAENRASHELDSLIAKSPVHAHVLEKNDQIKDISVVDVKIGDILLVRPLELVPVDGVLESETASLDQSSLTGETKEVKKIQGSEILSGSVNGDYLIKIKAQRLAIDSQFQQIVALVEKIKSNPATFVRLADRYAIPFTIIAYLIAGVSWFISKDPKRFAQVLVVASPCPLILSAPIAFVAGMSRLSKNNILVKNGSVLEKLSNIKTIFFDKTGTLTQGKLKVNDILPINKNMSKDDLLTIAASLEASSNHILAKSIVEEARNRKLQPESVSDLHEFPGQGVEGEILGQNYRLGNKDFTGCSDVSSKETSIYISSNSKYLGKITFIDKLRPDSKKVISELHDELEIKNLIMLTGDDSSVAKKIAQEVGIKTYYGNLLPDQKLEKIKDLPASEHPSAMVGDGINDAPALAYADVGVSMASGEDTVASQSADLVLLRQNLDDLVKAIKISRNTLKIAKQSVGIGIFICIGLMLVASTGIIPATLGALLQEVVDTVSILYALKALKEN